MAERRTPEEGTMKDRPSEKKQYERPSLRVYGTILDLTQNTPNPGAVFDAAKAALRSF
jgi:hypothetical protein